MEVKDWINIAYILIVIIVFIIQYYQIKKQNSLLSYYEKFFNIFKIEEIEKYVKLKEDNLNLEHDNKNKLISNILDDAEHLRKDSNKMIEKLHILLNDKDLIIEIIELNKSELKESYEIIFKALDNINDHILKESLNQTLKENISKFELERNDLMKKLIRN